MDSNLFIGVYIFFTIGGMNVSGVDLIDENVEEITLSQDDHYGFEIGTNELNYLINLMQEGKKFEAMAMYYDEYEVKKVMTITNELRENPSLTLRQLQDMNFKG